MKRFALPVLILLALCVACTVYIGMQRPLGGEVAALRVTQTPPTATSHPSATAIPSETVTATEAATPSPETSILIPAPVTRIPTRTRTPTVLPKETRAPVVIPGMSEEALTQTAVPAEETLSAIATRAFATPAPTEGPTPTPRAIDRTLNLLLLGSDMRPNDPTWLPATDVVMVVFLDRESNRVAILSLPRDLVVAIPGHMAFRINYVFQYGLRKGGAGAGAELLKRVLHDEFGIRIDHWALVDFNGLQKIIDTLGGIDVSVACPLEDTIDEQHFVIPAGYVHMDYVTAKRYIQSRYSTSDTSRNYRQQRVLWAMVKKGLQTSSPEKLPALWDQFSGSVQTDLTLFEMLGLAPAAWQLDLPSHPERIHAQVLEYPAVYPYVSSEGAWLYMPDYDQIRSRLDHLFEAPQIAGKADPAECPAPLPTQSPSATPTPSP